MASMNLVFFSGFLGADPVLKNIEGKQPYVTFPMALDNMDRLSEDKRSAVPKSGVIFGPRTVTFSEGENVYDVLSREMRNAGIPFDSDGYTKYSSAYVRGINNLYEFDCGGLSGWEYSVNDNFPNVGCNAYAPADGDVVKWLYTCDLGSDVGNVYKGDSDD